MACCSGLGISQFLERIMSGTIINSQTFLGKKAERFKIGTCLIRDLKVDGCQSNVYVILTLFILVIVFL